MFMFNRHDSSQRSPPTTPNRALPVNGRNTSGRGKGDGAMDTYAIVTEKIINLLSKQ